MRFRRLSLLPAALFLLTMSGCGYVHVGKLPEATTTVVGDDKLLKENADLRTEKKILQQELALTRAQSDALRFAIENRTSDGDTSKRLSDKLTDTARELAILRANYAKLQTERAAQPPTNPAELADLKAKLAGTEEKLATSLRNYTELQQEVSGLRRQIDDARVENKALAEHVKTVTAQNDQVRAALDQLNTDLLTQKESRTRAEQDAATLRTQLESANTRISTLSQQRTATAAEAKSIAPNSVNSAESAEMRAQLEVLQKKVSDLETERVTLQRQLNAAEVAAKAPGLADTKALADTQAQLIAALGSAKMLRDENDTLKAAATQAGSLKEQLAQVQAQATSLSEENAQLKNRLASSRPNTTITVGTAPAIPPAMPTANPVASSNPTAPTKTPGTGVTATFVVAPPGGAPAPSAAPAAAGAAPRPQVPGARYHTVAAGDTLSKIAAQYYGTPGRWAEILVANRDVLGEDNNLVIGRQLRIP